MAYRPPDSGATYMPGSFDNYDYHMPPQQPVLVAPAPQRHMPEMSDHIQEGMANLNMHAQDPAYSTSTSTAAAENAAFPKMQNRSSNVPPPDDEVEATLENARMPVLTSNDPEMQLAWAQDALQYVSTSAENEERLQTTQAPRPCTPRVEKQMKLDAMNIVGFLAEQHHPRAEFMRGMWHEFGRFGVAQDKKEAFRCYSRAADRGYARAEYRIGMLYEAANDAVKALKHYQRGVEAEDSASLYRLGMMTLRGQHGQAQDYVRGLDLIRRSAAGADENAPQGAYVYGMLLAKELPQVAVPDTLLPYDEKLARINIELAAFHKFAKAQLKMGSAYELSSLGCPFDPVLSLHYNRLASRQGEAEADMAISKWFLVGHEPLFAKNEDMAYMYAYRAAQTGLSTAQFAMGYFNELGIHVERNVDAALKWYIKAKESGNLDAPGRIEGINHKHVLSKTDHEKVALTRIRSQYGSKRGQRPARFQQGHPPRMSSISEQNGVSPAFVTSPGAPPPPRSSSTAPYPLDDRPPTVPPAGGRRAPSAVPYPLDDGLPPTRSPVSHGAYLNANVRPGTTGPERPSSAFSIDPNIRPMSANTAPVGRRIPTSPVDIRPIPMKPDPRGRSPESRAVSGPSYTQGRVPSGTGNRRPSIPPMPFAEPRIDIGYVAPMEDQRTRRTPLSDQQQPSYDTPSSAVRPPPQHLQHSDSTPNLHRPPRTSSRDASRPMSQGGPPPSMARYDDPAASASPAPGKPLPHPSPSPAQQQQQQQQQQQAPVKAAVSATPAKSGPKTFEEMGVPAQKQQGECIVM